MSTVLVTGGAGYIGTHVMAVLVARGHRCVCVDNYSNSSPLAVERVRTIAGGGIEAHEADLRDTERVAAIVRGRGIESVIHLAGLKAVGESVEQPERYFDNNVRGTESLIEALGATATRKFVFSSSATVYGLAREMPITEDAPLAPTNPYGETKLAVERMLGRLARSDPSWKIAVLRYFNPVGAHESGLIGEDPSGIPNNLMPYVCQVATGRREELRIFGSDYSTPDGTGVRDYIHVLDLAEGHVAALKRLGEGVDAPLTLNLGTGRGHSVLELVETFERVNRVAIPRRFVERRPGDVDVCYADCALARKVLGWEARRGLEDMCRDAWRWQKMNPEGYAARTAAA